MHVCVCVHANHRRKDQATVTKTSRSEEGNSGECLPAVSAQRTPIGESVAGGACQVSVDPKVACKRCVATPPNAVVRFSVNPWFHAAAAASSEYELKHDDNAKAPP